MSKLLDPSPAPEQAATTIVERWADVDGHRMRYLQCGQGPPVLLIHGLLAYAFSWRFTMPALGQRATCYAPDALGCGYSDRPDVCDRTMRGHAERMLRFLDAIGVGQSDVVGSSHGGAVAMLLAEMAPQRVRKLVLVSPANPWSAHGRLMSAFFATRGGASLFRRVVPRVRSLGAYFLARMFGDPRRVPPDSLEGYTRPLLEPGGFENGLGIVKSWKADMQVLKAAIPRIANIPTLLVWGSRDRMVSSSSAENLKQQFHNAKLVMLDGVGHIPYEEVPEEFNRVVGEFLALGDRAGEL